MLYGLRLVLQKLVELLQQLEGEELKPVDVIIKTKPEEDDIEEIRARGEFCFVGLIIEPEDLDKLLSPTSALTRKDNLVELLKTTLSRAPGVYDTLEEAIADRGYRENILTRKMVVMLKGESLFIDATRVEDTPGSHTGYDAYHSNRWPTHWVRRA